jgi:beta-fructofuranosidase
MKLFFRLLVFVCLLGCAQAEVKHLDLKFEKIYDPSVGEGKQWYINDHCFVKGAGGWHLFGITHAEPMNPMDEDNLAHATADRLTQVPWKKKPYALSIDAAFKEEHLWAPHVIVHSGLYYMYYCAGDKDHLRYKIHLATSKDLTSWKRHGANPVVVDGYDARPPFILKVGDEWAMYYTATSEPKGGNHIVVCVTSKDLINWSNRKVVFTDESKGTYGGPTESPFVVRRGKWYYLFIGPRGGYVGTSVYRSTDPFKWEPAQRAMHFRSHAAEVIRDTDGKWYVSHCGWKQGGVYLAPFEWADGLDDSDTSIPIPK